MAEEAEIVAIHARRDPISPHLMREHLKKLNDLAQVYEERLAGRHVDEQAEKRAHLPLRSKHSAG